MDILSIANKVACGGSDSLNTGKLGCLSLFGTPTHLLGFNKGFKIPANTTFNLAYLTPLVQTGKMVPLIGASSFEDTSAEDTYSTNAKGVKRGNLEGLPEYKLAYEEGHEFYRQLDKIKSFKSMDFIIGDDEGNWMLVTNADGTFGGFSAGHVTPQLTTRKVPGGDAEMKTLLIQFLNRLQFDRNYAILHAAQLDFYPEDILAVNGIHFEFTTVPSDGAGSLLFDAHLASDHNSVIAGLDSPNLVLTVDGAAATLGTCTEGVDGSYTLIVSSPSLATGQVLVLGTWDGSANANVIDLDGVLYRANEESVTVIA